MLKPISKLFAFIILGCACTAAHASTYYVSPAGNDKGPGVLASPFQSIQYAASKVNPGDTVIALDGVYHENYKGLNEVGVYIYRGGTSDANRVVFKAMNPGKAVLDGSSNYSTVLMGIQITADYVEVEGFAVANFFNGICVRASHITISKCVVHNNGNSGNPNSAIGQTGIYTGGGRSQILIDSNQVYANGRLFLTGSDTNGNKDQGLYICSSETTIQNNLIYGNQAMGIQIAGYRDIPNVIITNNTISREQNRGGIVLWLSGAKGVTIQNNIIVNNAHYGIGFLVDGGHHVIRNNILYGNLGGNIETSAAVQCLFSNNLDVDPKLTADYYLTKGSAAIGSGFPQYSPAYDLNGLPRSTGSVDLGCYTWHIPPGPTGLHITTK